MRERVGGEGLFAEEREGADDPRGDAEECRGDDDGVGVEPGLERDRVDHLAQRWHLIMGLR